MSSSSSSSKPSPAARMLFRGSSSALSAPEVSSVAVTGVTSQPQDTTTPSSSPSRSRTESSVTSSPSFLSKGKSPLSLLSGSTAPSISDPSTSTTSTTILGSNPPPPPPPPSTSHSALPNIPPPPDSRAIEEARTALLATLSNHFDREITPRARLLHQNNAAIEKQQNDLVKATAGLKKENDKLAKMADGYSKKVKEVGNVQNWAEMLEREFLILEDTLRRVREGGGSDSDEDGGSWTGSESYWSGSEEDGDGDGDGGNVRPEEVPLPEPGEGGL